MPSHNLAERVKGIFGKKTPVAQKYAVKSSSSSSTGIDLGEIILEESPLTPEQQEIADKQRNERAWSIFKQHSLQKLKNKNEFKGLENIEPTKSAYNRYELPFKLQDKSEYNVIIFRDIEWFAKEDTLYKPINEKKLSIYIENVASKEWILSLSISRISPNIQISYTESVPGYYHWKAESSKNKQQLLKVCMIIIRKFFNPANLFSEYDYKKRPVTVNLYTNTANLPIVVIKKEILTGNYYTREQEINIKDYMNELKEEEKTETPEQIALNIAKANSYSNYLRTKEWDESILGVKPQWAGAKKRRVTKKK